jgi:type IV pilus assembly protein PilM
MIAVPIKSRLTRIGLDIGAEGVRAVQLARERGGYSVRAIACSGAIRAPDDANASPEMTTAQTLEHRLQNCIRNAEFKGRDAYACVSGGDIEYHVLEIPKAVLSQGGQACDQAIRWEVASLMNEPADAIEAEHWQLPPSTTPGPNVLAVAIRHPVVINVVEACRRAKLFCTGLDASAAALSRFGLLLKNRTSKEVWGLLDFGATQARLVLCVEDVPVLVRTVGTGGRDWTKRISESLGISLKAAEVHKREHGIALQPRGLRSGESGADTHRDAGAELGAILLSALRTDLNELAAETQRSFKYVLSCYAGRQASELMLVGGGACMNNLARYLGSTLGIDVRCASDFLQEPSCRLKQPPMRGDTLESLALAIGLSISADDGRSW